MSLLTHNHIYANVYSYGTRKHKHIYIMGLFKQSSIRFSEIDPLANGLAEDIAREQREADAFGTLDDISPEELTRAWGAISDDIKKDPTWFSYTDE